VDPGSPADDAGLEPGMRVLTAAGHTLHDTLDWLWYASEDEVPITVLTAAGEPPEEAVLERNPGESWGLGFAEELFDGVHTCCNACVFCFMTMLPQGMRPALYLRDDDFRLSFSSGNFVTLTNITDEELERIIEQHLSPLNVSLHAVTPDVRARLMGKNAPRGLEVLERLLAAGIEVHAQVVLMRGYNSGEELDRTLQWVSEHPGITSLGIVPYGYTRYAHIQDAGFNAEQAQQVINQLTPWQQRSRQQTTRTRYHLADGFYTLANPYTPMLEKGHRGLPPMSRHPRVGGGKHTSMLRQALPPAEHYDGYPQYDDGIGMLRAFIDEWDAALAEGERGGEGAAEVSEQDGGGSVCGSEDCLSPVGASSAAAGTGAAIGLRSSSATPFHSALVPCEYKHYL
jgi:putative radical SAM enzyme (TIGR03279 family)